MPKNPTVWVGLNHPHGLVFPLGNPRVEVHINGNAEDLRGKESGILKVGEYGFTEVDTSLWDKVKAVYGRLPYFRHNLCFAEDTFEKAKAKAKELSETRHGREPIAVDGSDKSVLTEPAKK